MLLKKLSLIVKSRSMGVPKVPGSARLPKVKIPRLRFSFGQGKIKWVISGTVMLSGMVVAVGLYFAVIDIAYATYEYPKPGAVYPDLGMNEKVGQQLPPYVGGSLDGIESQTLEISLAAGARIRELRFENMQLGRTGLTDCIVVGRAAANTTGYLWADTFYLSGTTSAPSFDIANSEIHTLTVAGMVDGHTNSSTLDSTVSDITIESERGAGEFSSDGGVVDRILITLLGDATVKTVVFDDVDCAVGGVNFDYIKAGLFQQDATTKFGAGDGIDVANHVIQSSVKYRVSSDQMIDTPVTVK
jgi:hypothetical protein